MSTIQGGSDPDLATKLAEQQLVSHSNPVLYIYMYLSLLISLFVPPSLGVRMM